MGGREDPCHCTVDRIVGAAHVWVYVGHQGLGSEWVDAQQKREHYSSSSYLGVY